MLRTLVVLLLPYATSSLRDLKQSKQFLRSLKAGFPILSLAIGYNKLIQKRDSQDARRA